jgi:hypothetical protein
MVQIEADSFGDFVSKYEARGANRNVYEAHRNTWDICATHLWWASRCQGEYNEAINHRIVQAMKDMLGICENLVAVEARAIVALYMMEYLSTRIVMDFTGRHERFRKVVSSKYDEFVENENEVYCEWFRAFAYRHPDFMQKVVGVVIEGDEQEHEDDEDPNQEVVLTEVDVHVMRDDARRRLDF